MDDVGVLMQYETTSSTVSRKRSFLTPHWFHLQTVYPELLESIFLLK